MNENQAPRIDMSLLPATLPEPAELVRRAAEAGYTFCRGVGYFDRATKSGDPAGIAAMLAGCPAWRPGEEYRPIASTLMPGAARGDQKNLVAGLIAGFDHGPGSAAYAAAVAYGAAVADAAGLPAIHHPDAD